MFAIPLPSALSLAIIVNMAAWDKLRLDELRVTDTVGATWSVSMGNGVGVGEGFGEGDGDGDGEGEGDGDDVDTEKLRA